MRTLDRKLARDLWRLRAPLGAVALVMAAGVAALIMAWSTSASLRRSRDAYYDEGRFAEIFARLKRAPESLAPRLAQIPGVAVLHTRIVHDVNLSVPGMPDATSGRLVSLPDDQQASLNAVRLRRGRMPVTRTSEVVVSEPFAAANQIEPGDSLGAVINGRWQTLTVVGIGLSPEFVYFVRPGEMLPDNRRSGVLWMPRSALAEPLGMEGAFNDVVARLSKDAVVPDVIRQLDQLLDRYGGFGAYDRSDHISDRYLRDEFDQLAVMGTWTPAIFLAVGAFLVNVVLGRLVRTQREQIATLRAFGYSRWLLVRHVLLMASAVCLTAAFIGVVAGAALGAYLTSFYIDVFRFPLLSFALDPAAVVTGITVAGAASALGVLGALRVVVRLSPAEAMRPESPDTFRPTIVERLGVRHIPIRWRIAVRAVERHPWRSLLAALGIGMAAAVLVVSSFALDSIEHVIDREYAAAQRFDLTVTFNEPVHDAGVHSFRALLGGAASLRAEPLRIAAAKVSNAQVVRTTAIFGVEPGSELLRLLDRDGRRVTIPPDGLLISEHFAQILHVRPGDSLRVQLLEGRRSASWIPVSGVFSGYVGLTAYMHRDALNRLTGDGHIMSALLVREDRDRSPELQDFLKRAPVVASVSSKRGMLEVFRALIAQNITRITLLHAIFAGVIAFGVVYNTARIAFAERQRELATLRVLGFSRSQVSRLLLSEIALLTSLGLPLGLLLGRGLAWCLVRALQTESYELPLVISPRTYAFAALVTALAAALSAWVVRRGVAKLDLLSTLKEAG